MSRLATVPDTTKLLRAVRDAVLPLAWRQVELHERLGNNGARVLKDVLAAEVEEAQRALPPLARWPGLGEAVYNTYVGGRNHVRVRRIIDFVESGDRVLDIGTGCGYLGAALMRSGLPSYYCGIDLTERLVEATRKGIRSQGVTDERVQLEVRDLYDLTPEWVRGHDPDIVLLLEVLEHLPDTDRAFETLGSALADSAASVLFTVPLLDRLEGVWGHRSLFDRRRVEYLCKLSGLTIQYVQVLHDTWLLVLASAGDDPPSRLLPAALQSLPAPDPGPHGYLFEDVQLLDAPDAHRRIGRPLRGRARAALVDGALRCEVTPVPGHDGPHYGGIALPISRPQVTRLGVRYRTPEAIANVYADGLTTEGARVAQWRWANVPADLDPARMITHVLKRRGGGRLRAVGSVDVARIARLEIYVELRHGAERAVFEVQRAAFVPSPD